MKTISDALQSQDVREKIVDSHFQKTNIPLLSREDIKQQYFKNKIDRIQAMSLLQPLIHCAIIRLDLIYQWDQHKKENPK